MPPSLKNFRSTVIFKKVDKQNLRQAPAVAKGYLAKFLEKINFVENFFAIEIFCNHKVQIWPLIRLEFAMLWQEKERARPSPSPKKRKIKLNTEWAQRLLSRGPLLSWARRQCFNFGKKQASGWPKADWGALLASSKMTRIGENQWNHIFFDPLQNVLEPKFQRLDLFWNDTSEKSIKPDRVAPLISLAKRFKHFFRSPVSKAEKKVFEQIAEHLGLHQANLRRIKKQAGFILALSYIFEGALKTAGIKAFFLVCFYQPIGFALALACRKLGIPCVELQHGQQGDVHPMYTHWERPSKKVLQMLPSDFWVWGEESASRIRKWGNPANGFQVWVGGNPRLVQAIAEAKADYRSRRWNRPISRVLISLQFTELPDFIWETINITEQVEWWLRIHPRFLSEKEAFQELCKNKIKSKTKWLVTNSRENIYNSLKIVDLQLTGWSTTAYEALFFDVPTVLIHKNGLDAMANYIEKGIFKYAENSAALNEIIKNPNFKKSTEDNYIEADPPRIKKTFQSILQSKKIYTFF